MVKIEAEKIKLLKKEQRITARLSFKSKVIGERLAELEQMHESESRKRELTRCNSTEQHLMSVLVLRVCA